MIKTQLTMKIVSVYLEQCWRLTILQCRKYSIFYTVSFSQTTSSNKQTNKQNKKQTNKQTTSKQANK